MNNNIVKWVLIALLFIPHGLSASGKMPDLNSKDIIYGEGWGATREAADESAFASLSYNIQTIVSSDIITLRKNEKVSLLSSTISMTKTVIGGTEWFLEEVDGVYHVYRYINIPSYIKCHLENYDRIMGWYLESDGNYAKQATYLYLAYKAINNPIMDRFNIINDEMKADLKRKFRTLTSSMSVQQCLFKTRGGYSIPIEVPEDWWEKQSL